MPAIQASVPGRWLPGGRRGRRGGMRPLSPDTRRAQTAKPASAQAVMNKSQLCIFIIAARTRWHSAAGVYHTYGSANGSTATATAIVILSVFGASPYAYEYKYECKIIELQRSLMRSAIRILLVSNPFGFRILLVRILLIRILLCDYPKL